MLPMKSWGILLAVVLALLSVAQRSAEAQLLAGAAKRSIVPPFPTQMGGFTDRTDTYTGTHDDLFARALYLENQETRLMVIASDLMSVDADMTARIRANLEQATQVPASNIIVSCAHNHSAPSYYQLERQGESDPPLKKFLIDQFTAAGTAAYRNRVPARAGFRAGRLAGATLNRQQHNEEVIDPQVGVFKVEQLEGRKVIAILFNFTGHPVILGADNLLLSGEYPGAAARAVEELLGGVALFTQGACGDVTVHRSGDPFLEIERVGRTLAGEVIKTAGFIRGTADVPLAAASHTLELSPRTVPTVEETGQALERAEQALETARTNGTNKRIQRGLQQKLRLATANHRIAQKLADGSLQLPERLQAEVQVARAGDLVLVAIPGEIFVEYALELRSRIRQTFDRSMVLVGYANGYIGYIVTPRATQTGGYEASVARVGPEAGRLMTETALDLLTNLAE